MVEGSGPTKHWKKKVVREETVFKHHYNLLDCMLVTWEVFQLEMLPLNIVAQTNTGKKVVREETVFKHM